MPELPETVTAAFSSCQTRRHDRCGLPRCRGTGLYGRTGIFEVLDMTDGVRKLVAENADAAEIARQARADGMRTLREVAVHKLAAGLTSFEEVVRVTLQ